MNITVSVNTESIFFFFGRRDQTQFFIKIKKQKKNIGKMIELLEN